MSVAMATMSSCFHLMLPGQPSCPYMDLYFRTNDLPEPPTPLNTTAAESPNVTMDNGNTGEENVKVDIEECEECEDSNQLSII